MTDLETKLNHARKLLDIESKARREAEQERELLERRMTAVYDLLKNDREIKDETRNKFEMLNNFQKKRKSAHLLRVEEQLCNEINSTGSFLSDLSLTQSEDDFLDPHPLHNKSWKKHRSSYNTGAAQQLINKRKSRETRRSSTHKLVEIQGNEKIIAHAKVTVPQGNGPILAESVVEAVPNKLDVENVPVVTGQFSQKTPRKSPFKAAVMKTPSAPPLSEIHTNNNYQTPTVNRGKERQHDYTSKSVFKSELCTYCEKKIRFGSNGLKCKNCRVWTHTYCADKLSMACVPQSTNTPQMQKGLGSISDFVTQFKPMIPGLLIHCIDEIERRGINEVGIYRISGSERDIRGLKVLLFIKLL